MPLLRTIDRAKVFSQQAFKTFIFAFIFVYFGYHLISGENGIVSYFKQKAKLEKLETELSIVEQKREKLSGKAQKLHPSSLDADLLDEQYRRTTGKIKPNEVIYYYDN